MAQFDPDTRVAVRSIWMDGDPRASLPTFLCCLTQGPQAQQAQRLANSGFRFSPSIGMTNPPEKPGRLPRLGLFAGGLVELHCLCRVEPGR